MVCIYNGILLSHKKERIRVSSNEVDEPRACYSEVSQKKHGFPLSSDIQALLSIDPDNLGGSGNTKV